MIGILLALQVNNWNNERVNRSEEKKILEGMYHTLGTDFIQFQSGLKRAALSEKRIKTLQELIRSDIKVDSINILCGAVYGMHSFNLNSSSYEVLKSRGLNLIKDDSIRQLIVKVYDTHLKYIIGINTVENNVIFDVLRPYYLENFSNIRFLKNADPKDLNYMYRDDYYYNLLDYRITVIRSNILGSHPNIIADIENLQSLIEKYLKR